MANTDQSNSDVISRVLEHEQRRLLAERDAAIYATAGLDSDMDSLVRHVANTPLEIE